MSEWKKVKIDFPTVKLGDYISPIKTTVESIGTKNPTVYGVSNIDGITSTGKLASEDLSKYLVLEKDCFAFNPYRINVGSIGINENDLKGCVSPAYIVFKTKNGLNPKFLYYYLKSDYGIHLINWYGNHGGVRNALRYNDLCNIDIPDIKHLDQEILLEKLDKTQYFVRLISCKIEEQKIFLKELRQNILQDAVEGKLTEDWRKTHPVVKGNPDYDAEALFSKIQEEKQNLIAEGKIKKEKNLLLMSADDRLFETPQSWFWMKVVDFCTGFQYGTASKSVADGLCPVLRMGNIQNGSIDWEKLVYTNDFAEIEKYAVKKGDLLFNRTNSREWVGKTAIYNDSRQAIYAGYLVKFTPIIVDSNYLNIVMNSKTHRNWCDSVKTDALGQSNINAEKLKNFIAPIPPLAEQKEIVARVDKMLSRIDQIEQQILTRETIAKQLTQSILKTFLLV